MLPSLERCCQCLSCQKFELIIGLSLLNLGWHCLLWLQWTTLNTGMNSQPPSLCRNQIVSQRSSGWDDLRGTTNQVFAACLLCLQNHQPAVDAGPCTTRHLLQLVAAGHYPGHYPGSDGPHASPASGCSVLTEKQLVWRAPSSCYPVDSAGMVSTDIVQSRCWACNCNAAWHKLAALAGAWAISNVLQELGNLIQHCNFLFMLIIPS